MPKKIQKESNNRVLTSKNNTTSIKKKLKNYLRGFMTYD